MNSFKTKKIIKSTNVANTITENTISTQKSLQNQEVNFNNEKKKKHPLRKLIGIMIILASLAFFGIIGIQAMGKVNLSKKIDEIMAFNPITSLMDSTTNEEVVENQKGVKNILIAGIGGLGHPGGELTDSLMLASLDYDAKTVTLLSIPRDLYVAYSSNTAGKINALYTMGQAQKQGVNFLAKKVSEITGQPIHHYAIIDFTGFKSIVDALGGVEVNVPANIYDREYPNNNWGYEVFSLKKWLQTLDGETALKFARSRHSTSDFDRSTRQQLLLQAIKNKALSLGIITNPMKITELVDSVRNNLSTDLTVGDLADIGLNFKDMSNTDIITYSYNDICSGANCLPGSYLYTPMRDNFGGSWVLLPDGASKSRLSRYESMRKFANLIFQFPHIKNESASIKIVTNSKNLTRAKNLRQHLQQLGFPINFSETIVQTKENLGNSRIHAYYDKETQTGFSDESLLIQALKSIENSIPYSSSAENEFTKSEAPVIEIILGDDAKNFFKFTPMTNYQNSVNSLKNTTNSTPTKTQELPSEKAENTTTLPSEKTENSEKNSEKSENPLPSETLENTTNRDN